MDVRLLFNRKLKVFNIEKLGNLSSILGNVIGLSESVDQQKSFNIINSPLSIQSFDKSKSSKNEIIMDSIESSERTKDIMEEIDYYTKENIENKFNSFPIKENKFDQLKDKIGNFTRKSNFKYQKNLK